MSKMRAWIEAMRLRTLPVSLAGVVAGWAYAVASGSWDAVPGVICLVFALLAQIASNFANEYYDYTSGRDRRGREGPRRGVTEGDITPCAMRRATVITVGVACCVGLSLVAWSGWWIIAVGAVVALGVFAYSTGPYPLSTNGWGEVAVIAFFGLVPVTFTAYLMTGHWLSDAIVGSVAFGLMGANVLIINNYRDTDDDRAVGKRTLAVRWGARCMPWLYLVNVVVASVLLWPVMRVLMPAWVCVLVYPLPAALIASMLLRRRGAALTPLLGATACVMLLCAIALLIAAILA